jgi:hypothetical protein
MSCHLCLVRHFEKEAFVFALAFAQQDFKRRYATRGNVRRFPWVETHG